MAEPRDRPIRSEYASDPELEERIDVFLLGLGERLDLIQEADRQGDLKLAACRASELASEASALGFGPLEQAARSVAERCERGTFEGAHEGIVELTDVVRRVRLGHRGAF